MAVIIDQAKIDNSLVRRGPFPRSQEWWTGFVPMWVTATVGPGGLVELAVAPPAHPSQTPGRASRRRQEEALERWVRRLPLIGPAIVEGP
jgi:hypothetical protein